MSDPVRKELRSRAWGAMLQYAVFRWESAVIIALTLVLTALFNQPFAWWPWWGWLALGGAAEALVIVTSVTDAQTGVQVVADMFREENNPARLRDPRYRAVVERALAYHDQLAQEVATRPNSLLRDRLSEQVRQIDDWISGIYRLSERMESLEGDALLRQDFQTAPQELQRLTQRLRTTSDPQTQDQLRAAVEARQTQIDNLNALRRTMENAGLQLENTLGALGAVYAQMRLLTAKDMEGARARELQSNIAQQVRAIQDVVESLEEVRSRTQAENQ